MDYTRSDFTHNAQPHDVVFDLVGNLAPFVRHRIAVLTTVPSRKHLDVLRDHAEAGDLIPVIDRSYPLHEVPQALRYLEGEHTRAKVVITL